MDRKQQLAEIEQQKKQFQSLRIAMGITDTCWEKCIMKKDATKLSTSQKNCLHNCTQRYIDSVNFIAERETKLTKKVAEF